MNQTLKDRFYSTGTKRYIEYAAAASSTGISLDNPLYLVVPTGCCCDLERMNI